MKELVKRAAEESVVLEFLKIMVGLLILLILGRITLADIASLCKSHRFRIPQILVANMRDLRKHNAEVSDESPGYKNSVPERAPKECPQEERKARMLRAIELREAKRLAGRV